MNSYVINKFQPYIFKGLTTIDAECSAWID